MGRPSHCGLARREELGHEADRHRHRRSGRLTRVQRSDRVRDARSSAPQRWLRVVAAAQLPEYSTVAYGTVALPAPQDVIDDATKAARQTVDNVVRAHPELAAVEFTLEAIAGPPGPPLVDASDGADLLVLGHRGRGALRSALLGSVGLLPRPARDLPGHRRPAHHRFRGEPRRSAGLR